jgi:hypothetical protein
MVSLSAVQGKESMGSELTVENTGDTAIDFAPVLIGKDAAAFSLEPRKIQLTPGQTYSFKISLSPVRGAGIYQASLDISEGAIPIEGVGLKAFEGKNEPTLEKLCKALGMEIDVGGTKLELDTEAETIGESLAVSKFQGIEGKTIRVTPLARFSPPGEVPFGIVQEAGKLIEWGKLDGSDESRPDNHQCLFPGINGGKSAIEMKAPDGSFAFYMQGHLYVSFSDTSLETAAQIKNTARVYPVKTFQGREMQDSYIVGFEEAKNGDYQDAVFLLENVTVE